MSWKNLPSWLKGGIILEIVVIVLAVILFPFKFSFGFFTKGVFLPYSIFLGIPAMFILDLMGLNVDNFFTLIPLSIIIYFFIGAIIDLIYEKIKNRKNKNYQL